MDLRCLHHGGARVGQHVTGGRVASHTRGAEMGPRALSQWGQGRRPLLSAIPHRALLWGPGGPSLLPTCVLSWQEDGRPPSCPPLRR